MSTGIGPVPASANRAADAAVLNPVIGRIGPSWFWGSTRPPRRLDRTAAMPH